MQARRSDRPCLPQATGLEEVVTPALRTGRPGRVHDRVATYQREWRGLLEQTARAILAGTNIAAVLHDDDRAIDHARRAVAARLAA